MSVLAVGWELNQEAWILSTWASPWGCLCSFNMETGIQEWVSKGPCRSCKASYDLVSEGPGCHFLHLLLVKQITKDKPDPVERVLDSTLGSGHSKGFVAFVIYHRTWHINTNLPVTALRKTVLIVPMKKLICHKDQINSALLSHVKYISCAYIDYNYKGKGCLGDSVN